MKQNARIGLLSSVVTLDDESLGQICAQLMKTVEKNYCPDVMIGIRSGGYFVAQGMLEHSISRRICLLGVKKQRDTTKRKTSGILWMAMLKHTPYFILDRLRIVEHFVLSSTFGRESEKSDLTPAIWDDGLPISNDKSQNLNILIVDDAIDTGKTMLCVLQEVKHRCPDATVKTAVITITTKKPLVIPNYCLFHLQLFRFPWSADVK